MKNKSFNPKAYLRDPYILDLSNHAYPILAQLQIFDHLYMEYKYGMVHHVIQSMDS